MKLVRYIRVAPTKGRAPKRKVSPAPLTNKAKAQSIPILPEIIKKIRQANAGMAPTAADLKQQKLRVAMSQCTPAAEYFFGNSRSRVRREKGLVRVTKVEANKKEEFPHSRFPEVCFAGRSNVGKSSLLNKVMGKDGFAATSLLPGETRAITFYCVQQALHLVDLPGYGFAHATEEKREEWLALMRAYFSSRRQLRHVFLLLDAKVGMKPIDRDLVKFLNQYRVRFSIVLTKTDLVPEEDLARMMYLLREEEVLKHSVDPDVATSPILVSAKVSSGVAKLKNIIVECIPKSRTFIKKPTPTKPLTNASTTAHSAAMQSKVLGTSRKANADDKADANQQGESSLQSEEKRDPLELLDQSIVESMQLRKAKMKRLKAKKKLKRELQRQQEAKDPSLLVYRLLLRQHKKENNGKRVKRNTRRRLRLLSKVKAGLMNIKVPKNQGQASALQPDDPYAESQDKHRKFQGKGELVHLFEETYQFEEKVPRGERRWITPQELGTKPNSPNTVELRMEGGWQDTQLLEKVKEELQQEAKQMRQQAAAADPVKKEPKRRTKGRWRDIPRSGAEEDLYHPEPLSDRQYFKAWYRQQRLLRQQEAAARVQKNNPYFLG